MALDLDGLVQLVVAAGALAASPAVVAFTQRRTRSVGEDIVARLDAQDERHGQLSSDVEQVRADVEQVRDDVGAIARRLDGQP